MALPPLRPEQRRAALDKAAAARKERAEVKDALKHGRTSLAEVLASDSAAIRKMQVRALLESLPDIGKVRAQKLLTEVGISEARRIQGLGIQQRERLLERFGPLG
ncbi:integration host factor, actinobacterial type [Streptomyces sp. FXJ1.172]|uniref:integration host factor, actinobacterial type n=1 Tax=Streptomyces sp. FXJ1.172 TaxID=710705 RepID=UPI0007CF3F4F|nr:integration host factor, actinobacterial type [Streptomyces sp. FXJ1.172]WEO92810.1 integration host factor, actinobacterial type [Streptomyces sp. FXJ1.172]